jgi:hypothetical protein
MPQDRGIKLEKSGDEFAAIIPRCELDEPGLNGHPVVAQQPRRTLQLAYERCKIVIENRADDPFDDKRPPRPCVDRIGRPVLDEIGDERAPAGIFIHVLAEFGIEGDRSLQQDGCDVLMPEAAGAHEGFVDGCEIVRALGKSGANRVDITERGKKLERARQQAVTLK